MANEKISFHLQQTARPEHIEKIIIEAPENDIFDSKFIYNKLIEKGYSIQLGSGVLRSLNLCRKLDLVEAVGNSGYKISERGSACRKLSLYRRDVFFDIIHFLLFASWKLKSNQNYWSWTYSKTSELLWKSSPKVEKTRKLFGELYSEAIAVYPDLNPAVGEETIDAVKNWIKMLAPSFLITENSKKTSSLGREWFSVELAVLSVYYLYLLNGSQIRTPILLDKSALERLSPLCLSAPDRILFMIDLAAKTYPFLELHTGEWGSSAVLHQKLDIQDLI